MSDDVKPSVIDGFLDGLKAKVDSGMLTAGVVGEQSAVTPPPAETPAPVEDKVAEEKVRLAEQIRKDREDRQARARQAEEQKTRDAELNDLRQKVAAFSSKDIVKDAIGWAEANGLTQEEIAAVGETLLYSLVPDKADANVRIRLMEAKAARTAKLEAEAAEKARVEAERKATLDVQSNYFKSVQAAAEAVPAGTYPDSEAWFGGSQEEYTSSLIQTAMNMAETAKAAGKVANLTFDSVAAELEAHLTERYNRRKGSKPVETVKSAQAPVAVEKPSEQIDLSQRGLTGGGSPPRPAAKTEQERMQRAMEVLFGR
jgi:hypothetical protein